MSNRIITPRGTPTPIPVLVEELRPDKLWFVTVGVKAVDEVVAAVGRDVVIVIPAAVNEDAPRASVRTYQIGAFGIPIRLD